METPAARFLRREHAGDADAALPLRGAAARIEAGLGLRTRSGPDWVARRVAANGILSVAWQVINVGRHRSGASVDVHVSPELVQVFHGAELIKTVVRSGSGPVRKKRASVQQATEGAKPLI